MKKGWEIKKLGELVNIRTGKLDANAMVKGGKFPFFTCSRDVYSIDKYAFDCEAILLAGNNASGDFNVKHYKGKFNAYQRTYIITVKENSKILYNLLNHHLVNHLKKFKEQSVGTNTKFLKLGMIQEMEIPLPPLPEQQRIVAILDETFDAIDMAKAIAEQNLKNAKELFNNYLQSIFENQGEGWEEKSLGEVCEYDKSPNKKSNLPYIGLEDIQSNSGRLIGPLTPRSVKSLTFNFTDEHVLYGRLRPYLNKVLLPDFEGHCSTEIFPIKPRKGLLIRSFLFHWLISSQTVGKINATWTGATLPRANMNSVLEFKLSIPSIKQQQTIVKKIDALNIETKKLETIYQQKINDLEELKRSILQKAFSGQLKTTEYAI